MSGEAKAEAAAPTTKELVEWSLMDQRNEYDDYARNFLKRMLAGDQPSEWDFAAAQIAADSVVLIDEVLARVRVWQRRPVQHGLDLRHAQRAA